MTYNEALKKVRSLKRLGSQLGLDRLITLLERIGNPHKKLKIIHVAGTNGKGSVCTMLSAILTRSGLKTGLFISPYITDFRERIQINEHYIRTGTFIKSVEIIFPEIEKLMRQGVSITEFEMVCAVAFYCFALEKCDIVVLETGLGGRLDATNVVPDPLCSVITCIGLDHMNILGNTIQSITFEKCGIIKDSGVTIMAKQNYGESREEIIKQAVSKHNSMIFSEELEAESISSSIFENIIKYRGVLIRLSLKGHHQIDNVKVVISVINFLISSYGCGISFDDLTWGLEHTKHPGRMELMNKNPIILLDGAHNLDSFKALVQILKTDLNNKQGNICIFGMLKDKDISSCISAIKNHFTTVITVPISSERSLTEFELAEHCKNHFGTVIPSSDVTSAFETAYGIAKKTSKNIVICGSLYLVSEIRPYILKTLQKPY